MQGRDREHPTRHRRTCCAIPCLTRAHQPGAADHNPHSQSPQRVGRPDPHHNLAARIGSVRAAELPAVRRSEAPQGFIGPSANSTPDGIDARAGTAAQEHGKASRTMTVPPTCQQGTLPPRITRNPPLSAQQPASGDAQTGCGAPAAEIGRFSAGPRPRSSRRHSHEIPGVRSGFVRVRLGSSGLLVDCRGSSTRARRRRVRLRPG